MDALLTALGEPARWRLVTLLAERPRPVGVLAELAGARQPQTTKHLQTLERAGVVISQRSGQRRVYALRSEALRDLAAELTRLADLAEAPGGARETFDRYAVTMDAERLAAERPGWADGRTFRFDRTVPADPGRVWRHLTEPALLARWWSPDDLRVSGLVFEPRPGGRIALEYRDAEDTGATDDVVGRAEGVVDEVVAGERLAYRSSPLLPDGSPAFTSHVELTLRATARGTDLEVRYRISGSTVESADFVAGIELGFGQSLDRLVADLADETHRTDTPHTHPSDRSTT